MSRDPIHSEFDKSLLAEFASLWSEVDEIWERDQNERSFSGYVSADYIMVFEALTRLRGHASTLLEWGSGLGVVSIMASRMGFDAWGIEAESELVDHAENLAVKYNSTAQFAHGSFIPDEFAWHPATGEELNSTIIDKPAVYGSFDLDLQDFDLVYAYPWPEEHQLYRTILREFGRQDVMLLTYDGREGMELSRFDGQ